MKAISETFKFLLFCKYTTIPAILQIIIVVIKIELLTKAKIY